MATVKEKVLKVLDEAGAEPPKPGVNKHVRTAPLSDAHFKMLYEKAGGATPAELKVLRAGQREYVKLMEQRNGLNPGQKHQELFAAATRGDIEASAVPPYEVLAAQCRQTETVLLEMLKASTKKSGEAAAAVLLRMSEKAKELAAEQRRNEESYPGVEFQPSMYLLVLQNASRHLSHQAKKVSAGVCVYSPAGMLRGAVEL